MFGKRIMKWLLAGLIAMSLSVPLSASAETEDAPADPVEKKLTVSAGGKNMPVTARTGFMKMDTSLGKYEIFYTAYTADNGGDPSARPITFVFNGGPGAPSLYLHLGMMGPERIETNAEGMLEKIPAGTKKNEYTILDMTDLVFIDPVGTGFSKAEGDTEAGVFYSSNSDIVSIGDFIRQYLAMYDRMGSPKYIAGESYGTTRAIGVADYLSGQWGLDVNGLMLISSVNDFLSLSFTGANDLPYVNFLPSYAASAWYHGLLSKNYQDMELETYLEEVRSFASGEYLSALYKGSRLTTPEKNAIAEKMASYIGLKKEDILENNLRINYDTFCMTLLSDKKLTVGRIDSRYTGPTTSTEIGSGAGDPSYDGISPAFTSAYLDYAARTLGYKTEDPYYVFSLELRGSWNFNKDNEYLSQEDTIRSLQSRNKFLKIWVMCGYYDLATPFYGSEWVYSHIFANDELKDQVSFTYYPAGHMFYLNEECLKQFHADAEKWFKGESIS